MRNLDRIINESIKDTMFAYIQMKQNGRHYDVCLNDDDFLELVDRVVEVFDPDDFETDYVNEIEDDIIDMIIDFVDEKEIYDWWYKYRATNYPMIAHNIIRYIQKHLNELY